MNINDVNVAKMAGIQGNDRKEFVREHLRQSALDFAKKESVPLDMLTLPASDWFFEKGMIRKAKDTGVTISSITGVESDSQYFWAVNDNSPKEVTCKVLRGDIDSHIKSSGSTHNFVWADYCGFPAQVKNRDFDSWASCYRMTNTNIFYKYPHIDAMARFIENTLDAGKKAIYAMTFDISGAHLVGGKAGLIRAMGGASCKTLGAAINAKVIQKVGGRINLSVFLAKRIVYRGSGLSTMITLVYTIGFKPDTVVDEDWTNKPSVASVVPVAPTKINITKTKSSSNVKQKIRDMADKGIENAIIAKKLNLTRNQVGAVLAWHHNRDSWG